MNLLITIASLWSQTQDEQNERPMKYAQGHGAYDLTNLELSNAWNSNLLWSPFYLQERRDKTRQIDE